MQYAWFDKGDGRQAYRPVHERSPARSSLPMPIIISDAMPPTQSMADGKIYESKSGISAATRRAGFRELGNDKLPPRQRPKVSRQEIKASIERATARVERGERA